MVALGCGGDDGPASDSPDASAGGTGATAGAGGSPSGGAAGTGASAGASGAGTGGVGGSGGTPSTGGAGGTAGAGGVVGNPALFTQPVLELDFAQGTNGSFRASGGAWTEFGAWSNPGVNGNWSNDGVNVQTTTAVRTEIVKNAHGAGSVLRTWIEAGDQWKSSATYPRTELTSKHTAGVAFGSEWRLELPLYVTGDTSSTGASIIGFQFHHNGNTGSPPFALELNDGALRFSVREGPSSSATKIPMFPLKADTLSQLVFEVKFGYATDGAYVRLWADGTQYVNVTDKNIGYPDLESTAGYWKFCSLYDWSNAVSGSRSVFSGPTVRFLRRP